MGCVYQAKNRVNGKCYIGKTVRSLRYRRYTHYSDVRREEDSSPLFHRALRKYGLEGFEWSILYESDDADQLALMERTFIRTLGSKHPGGYNLTDGGEGSPGGCPSAETRKKLSEAAKGRPKSAKALEVLRRRNKGNIYALGKKFTQEHKDKIAASRRGKKRVPFSAEARRNMAASHIGSKRSEETKEKIRESALRRWAAKNMGHP